MGRRLCLVATLGVSGLKNALRAWNLNVCDACPLNGYASKGKNVNASVNASGGDVDRSKNGMLRTVRVTLSSNGFLDAAASAMVVGAEVPEWCPSSTQNCVQ